MSIALARRRRVWRRSGFTLVLFALALYFGSYLQLRRHHELVHARSYDEHIFHSIQPGESGPSLFAAAALSGKLDQLDAIGTAQERRERFQMALYAPARYAEVLFWCIID